VDVATRHRLVGGVVDEDVAFVEMEKGGPVGLGQVLGG
jgi:hypothetical protein